MIPAKCNDLLLESMRPVEDSGGKRTENQGIKTDNKKPYLTGSLHQWGNGSQNSALGQHKLASEFNVKQQPAHVGTAYARKTDELLSEVDAQLKDLSPLLIDSFLDDSAHAPFHFQIDEYKIYKPKFIQLKSLLLQLTEQQWLKDDAALIKKLPAFLIKDCFLLDCVAEEARTWRLCKNVLKHNPQSVDILPERFRTPHFFLDALSDSNRAEQKNICFALYHYYIPMPYSIQKGNFSEHCPTIGLVTSWLSNMIHNKNRDFFGALPKIASFEPDTSKEDRPSNTKPELRKSLRLCLDYSMPGQKMAEQLKAFLQRHTSENAAPGKLQTLSTLPKPEAFYGNRSFSSFLPGNQVNCFKFQIEKEDWGTFIAEDGMHRFCQDYQPLGLESEIPEPGGLYKIACDDVPESILHQLKEVPARYKFDGRDYYIVYNFKASRDYTRYCNNADNQDDIIRAEQGMLKAAADLGQWCNMGILYLEPLKIWHTHTSDKNMEIWRIFQDVHSSKDYLPGLIREWKKDIDKPDFGFSGLRDLGDFCFYGQIPVDRFTSNSRMTCTGFNKKLQVVEVLGRSILGIMLVYQDLHLKQCSPSTEVEAIRNAGAFFDQVCSRIFKAFPGGADAFEQCKADEDYQDWKSKAMVELYVKTKRKRQVLTLDTLSNGLLFLSDIATRCLSAYMFEKYCSHAGHGSES